MSDGPEVFMLVKLKLRKELALLLWDVRTFTMFLCREMFS